MRKVLFRAGCPGQGKAAGENGLEDARPAPWRRRVGRTAAYPSYLRFPGWRTGSVHCQLDERRDHGRHGTEDRDRLGERTWPAPR